MQIIKFQRRDIVYQTQGKLKKPLRSFSLNAEIKSFQEVLASDVKLEMVEIPGGTFMMGSSSDELNSKNDECPQHQVNIQPLFMSKYAITQKQWQQVAAFFPQVTKSLISKPSFFSGVEHPVEQISWYDANEFCARLSKLTSRNYRLPSEAEWEYACRAGTITSFYFGEKITNQLANYSRKHISSNRKFNGQTSPVGSFPANAFGLHDMHGQVWEWCIDTWHDTYDDAPTDNIAWVDSNQFRVVRGGSWYSDSVMCRSAYRHRCNPKNKYEDIGFRVVCDDVKVNSP
ncbi:hypothetical protein NIES2111_57940 (plasmid) [Nostoc sp. NIES-2111]|nr:hypothetical protein NIES2111_57940 [Nostoc sp. NIES-2111]